MPRDKEIRISFEIADDGIQGVLGYFFYVIACRNSASAEKILSNLPENSILITHEWFRYYNKQHLVETMKSCFEPYHARVCLVSVIGIFEGAIKKFIERLSEERIISNNAKRQLQHYKKKLEWSFDIVSGSTYGTETMQARIPDLCLQVDHARRIRNLWMHNNGLLNRRYAEDSISVNGHPAIVDDSYQKYNRSRKKKIPVVLKPEGFIYMCLSHIEFLHQLHYCIQKQYFGQKRSYSYKASRKHIEWHRLLVGI